MTADGSPSVRPQFFVEGLGVYLTGALLFLVKRYKA